MRARARKEVTEMVEDYFVRKAEAARRFGVQIRTLERWEGLGFFPRRVQIGPGAVGYRASELELFAKSRQYADRRKSEAASAPEAA
jgi:predicted DNA-binding transcriptional regulator AlpA